MLHPCYSRRPVHSPNAMDHYLLSANAGTASRAEPNCQQWVTWVDVAGMYISKSPAWKEPPLFQRVWHCCLSVCLVSASSWLDACIAHWGGGMLAHTVDWMCNMAEVLLGRSPSAPQPPPQAPMAVSGVCAGCAVGAPFPLQKSPLSAIRT